MVKGREEPRIFTPPLRDLTPDTSIGFEVADFAESVLGIDLIPWQRWLLIHALETIDEPDGSWRLRFRKVIVLVGRQNGKTTLSTIIALYFLYVLRVGLILGTAQDVSNAEDTWSLCVDMAQSNEALSEEIRHVWYTNGSKRLQLDGGRDYRVRASNRRAGRGKSADLVLLDELREHQTWDAYAALEKTGMARRNALLWCMSNAGDATSVVLRHFRARAHALLGDPDGIANGGTDPEGITLDDTALGLFEWSANPEADKHDRDAWAQANPSMGYTIEESTLRSACADDPESVFRTECLCQWVEATALPPFPEGAWESGTDDTSQIADIKKVTFGIDLSADRTMTVISAYGLRDDGSHHVEVLERRYGTEWAIDWFSRRLHSYGRMRLAFQGRGAPVSGLAEQICTLPGIDRCAVEGSELTNGFGRFYDAVANGTLYHLPQPVLDMPARTAVTRNLGNGSMVIDRIKSPDDAAPLIACIIAFTAGTSPASQPVKSAYSDGHSLVFV